MSLPRPGTGPAELDQAIRCRTCCWGQWPLAAVVAGTFAAGPHMHIAAADVPSLVEDNIAGAAF